MKAIYIFLTVMLVGFSTFTEAQEMPDTVGLPPAVTQYIAELSAAMTTVSLEKNTATTALEKLREEYEILKASSAEEAKEAMEDIERLEDAVDLRKKRITELEASQAKGETDSKTIEQKNKTLTSELKNLRNNHKKLNDKLKKQEKEAKKVKSFKSEAEKVPGLEAKRAELEGDLSTALQEAQKYKQLTDQKGREISRVEKERDDLKRQLAASERTLTQLKKDCEAYAQKVKEDLQQLEKDAGAVMRAPNFTISINERRGLVNEAKRLQEVVADKEMKRHQQVYALINKILAFGEVMDDARAQLNKDYDGSGVKASASNLKNADVTGFSPGVVQERDKLLNLLNGYCKEYARVKGFFDQINEAKDVEITESFLPRYLDGQYSVDKAYGFLRGELEKRKANSRATNQPFTVSTNCN